MQYIKTITIDGLWDILDLEWNVTPEVNVLAGGNGSGKSTVLRSVSDMFRYGCLSAERANLTNKITITFEDGTIEDSLHTFNPAKYQVSTISTFDKTMKESEAVKKLSKGEVLTELDWELYILHSEYLDYQLEISKEVIKALYESKPTAEIISHKELYFDILDSLFHATGKKIDRKSNSIAFLLDDHKIPPYKLSSGEKQILIILTSVLVQNRRPAVMIMDEPEVSLHFDWQRRLIDEILKLNPNIQLLIATHSPAMVMNGWVDRVVEISELVVGSKIII